MAVSDMDMAARSYDHDRAKRNVAMLSAAQALGGSMGAIVISTGGLVGVDLAPDPSLVTLPVTAFILGTALSTIPANLLMRHTGRKLGYTFGALTGVTATLLGAFAIWSGAFFLFVLAMAGVGGYWAFVQSYRFAAADTASEAFKPKAISWVMGGGIAAAVIGPQTVIWTKGLLETAQFAGTFVAAAGLAALALVFIARLDIPKPPSDAEAGQGRSLPQIVLQPRFVIAALCGATAYFVMSFVMTASPLAMVGGGHTIELAALGIQWHVLAMYLPSFFAGPLIARFGRAPVITAGMLLLTAAALTALSGVTILHFWAALVFLGVGWNFGFIGATAMVTDCHAPEERNKVQATNDFLIFGLNAIGSFSAGMVLSAYGWYAVNLTVLPAIVLCLLGLAWLVLRERRATVAA